jgi:chorismate dehydratase
LDKVKISAVSYTNTQPFIYGLRHTDIIHKINLSLDIPADCAQKLIDHKADIGLIPVAAVIDLPHWEIVSDYCIGADGPVNSVFIFSNCEIHQVKTLQLDPESRSSNNLARVLLQNYWQLTPQMVVNTAEYGQSDDPNTAFVQIGDRTFGKKDKYAYTYDLAEEWKAFTGLPFVFAAWIANKNIPKEFIAEFNDSLKYGLDNRQTVINQLPARTDFDLDDYLMHKLDFSLTADKIKALYLFIDYIKKLSLL